MGKLRKTWTFEWSEKKIASNSLSVVGGDLLSIDASGYVVKSTAGTVIEGVAVGEAVYAADNQTVANAVIDYPTVNSEMRIELDCDATLTQAMVNDKFDIDDTQEVVTGAAGTQVQLVEIVSATVGSFKAL